MLNDLASMAATVIRGGRGSRVRPALRERRQPERLLELYDFEACPYCRKVREKLSELNLDFIVRTVPRGSNKRADLRRLGGRIQVPFLVDPNTKVQLYESDGIVAYLEQTYGAPPP